MEKITHIEKIEIEGLWGKYYIEWHLNPDVNILAGINGSGKSTILNIIAGVLTDGNFVGEVDNWINEVKISFNDNKVLSFLSNRKTIDQKTIQHLKKNGNNQIQKQLEQLQENLEQQQLKLVKNATATFEVINQENDLAKVEVILPNEDLNEFSFKSSVFRFCGFTNTHEKISNVIKISKISTFEQLLKTQSVTQNQSLPEKIKTDLDIQIFELQRAYLSYQINLGKKVERIFSEDTPIDIKTKREEIYGKKALFTQTINQLFAQTGKTIESDKSNEIVFRQNGKELTPYQLSSGEKQVLLILLSALIQDNEPYILIMDEPEISLHIDWQEQLIQVIRNLNENVQVILATHSPALVMKGWMDKVTEMEDITRQE
jgi:energy-coupling factor transporter ATP-binding protein EcfA2